MNLGLICVRVSYLFWMAFTAWFQLYNYAISTEVRKIVGVGDGVVVKALRHKPAGRGFDSRWFHWNF
jgi:hypothetical protein